MLISVLAIIAFVLILIGKLKPNPNIDLFWVGVLLLSIIHLVASVPVLRAY
jgi:hypothetical protein